MLRRLRLGDVQKVLRNRYGHTLPDDDAGREDLGELLLPISLGSEPERKMRNAIEIWAPWMSADEAGQLIDTINQMPSYQRKTPAHELGVRLGLTYQQRKQWGIRTIAPCDMTPAEFLERRKGVAAHKRYLRRRNAGIKPRSEYLATSKSRTKQWEVEGKTRRTWYRQRGTSLAPIKLPIVRDRPVPLKQGESHKERGLPRKQVEVSKKVARA